MNNWLIQIAVYFAFNYILENQRTLFASTFLREKAKNWFKSILRKYFNKNEKKDNEDIKRFFFKFINFKKKITRVFDIFNEKQTTKRNIQYIRQKSSIAKYAARFQEQANLIKWNDASLMTMYRRELKNSVKKKSTISKNLSRHS